MISEFWMQACEGETVFPPKSMRSMLLDNFVHHFHCRVQENGSQTLHGWRSIWELIVFRYCSTKVHMYNCEIFICFFFLQGNPQSLQATKSALDKISLSRVDVFYLCFLLYSCWWMFIVHLIFEGNLLFILNFQIFCWQYFGTATLVCLLMKRHETWMWTWCHQSIILCLNYLWYS